MTIRFECNFGHGNEFQDGDDVDEERAGKSKSPRRRLGELQITVPNLTRSGFETDEEVTRVKILTE